MGKHSPSLSSQSDFLPSSSLPFPPSLPFFPFFLPKYSSVVLLTRSKFPARAVFTSEGVVEVIGMW